MFLLFFSKRCIYSSKVINFLNKSKNINKFKLIEINNSNKNLITRYNIKIVPTIVLYNKDDDSYQNLYGSTLFSWLQKQFLSNNTPSNPFDDNITVGINDNTLISSITGSAEEWLRDSDLNESMKNVNFDLPVPDTSQWKLTTGKKDLPFKQISASECKKSSKTVDVDSIQKQRELDDKKLQQMIKRNNL